MKPGGLIRPLRNNCFQSLDTTEKGPTLRLFHTCGNDFEIRRVLNDNFKVQFTMRGDKDPHVIFFSFTFSYCRQILSVSSVICVNIYQAFIENGVCNMQIAFALISSNKASKMKGSFTLTKSKNFLLCCHLRI